MSIELLISSLIAVSSILLNLAQYWINRRTLQLTLEQESPAVNCYQIFLSYKQLLTLKRRLDDGECINALPNPRFTFWDQTMGYFASRENIKSISFIVLENTGKQLSDISIIDKNKHEIAKIRYLEPKSSLLIPKRIYYSDMPEGELYSIHSIEYFSTILGKKKKHNTRVQEDFTSLTIFDQNIGQYTKSSIDFE